MIKLLIHTRTPEAEIAVPVEESVTFWIEQLKAGDKEAARPLWERYFSRLVHLARQRLRGTRRAVADEEDVALSAFDSFCRAAEQGRFPQLNDRDDLWRLLVVITERKSIDLARRQHPGKQKGPQIVSEADLPDSSDTPGLGWVPAPEPTPEFAALLADEFLRLFRLLDDDQLHVLAQLKFEGYSNPEIAQHLQCGLRTVERKLALIRGLWEPEVNG